MQVPEIGEDRGNGGGEDADLLTSEEWITVS